MFLQHVWNRSTKMVNTFTKGFMEEKLKPYWQGYNATNHKLIDILHHVATVPYKSLSSSNKKMISERVYPAVRDMVKSHAYLRDKLTDNEIKDYAENLGRAHIIKDIYGIAKEAGDELVPFDYKLIEINLNKLRSSIGDRDAAN